MDNPTIKPMVAPFKKFCMSIGALPTSYKDSLDYYETLLWLIKYLENVVIPVVNNNGEAVTELQNLYIELKNYVEHYFDNLDVQEEIDNKLDNMVEQGTLQEIVADYLNSKAIFGFDNVNSMKNSTNLIDGSYARTLGYHSINDGGGSLYKIREITNSDVVDEMTIIAIGENNLVGVLIYSNSIVPEQFGAYGDGIHDDTLKIQKCLNIQKNIELKDGSIYLITGDLNLPRYTHIEGNNSTIKINYTGSREHMIRNSNWLINDNYINELYINNLNFYYNSSSKYLRILGLTNYDKIIIKNCNCSTNEEITYGCNFYDLYSNNRNIYFNNNVVTILNIDETIQNTNFSIRQYSPTGKTYNANVTNSTFYHNGRDETVWIDGWFGELNNLIFANNKVIDKSTTDFTICWIGIGTEGGSSPRETSKMENIIVDNCLFEKDSITQYGIKIGCITTDYAGLNRLKNFILRNSIINIKTGNGSAILSYDKSVSIENCIFNYYGSVSWNYGYCITGNYIAKDCIFNIHSTFTGQSTAFGGNCELYNCIFNGNGKSFTNGGTKYLKNCKIYNVNEFLLITSNSLNNVIIDSCNIITTSYLFNRSNATDDQTIKIINCDITTGDLLFQDYGLTGNKNIILINNNFNSTSFELTNSSTENININNCTHNGVALTGIPSYSSDRASLVIGTVFNGGAGHSVVRKISDGNQTTDWETI